MVTTKKIDSKTYIFEEEGVRFFLLSGSKKALLIDSGMRTHNAKELARELTKLPLFLINTHADIDHIGSNGEFDSFFMNLAECSNFYNSQRQSGKIVPVHDGDIIELGDRPLKIIETPGHTPGSIAILDIKKRRIFTGDPIQDGRIFMFGVQREMHAYIHSLERIMSMSGEFDEIFPSHGTCPKSPDIIKKLHGAALEILTGGGAKGKREEIFGKPIVSYDMGVATFLCDDTAKEDKKA